MFNTAAIMQHMCELHKQMQVMSGAFSQMNSLPKFTELFSISVWTVSPPSADTTVKKKKKKKNKLKVKLKKNP